MQKLREISALARRPGYQVRFFQLDRKFRLDFFAAEEESVTVRNETGKNERKRSGEEKRKRGKTRAERLGMHFWALLKILFRGRGEGAKERVMGIIGILYFYKKIMANSQILVSRSVFFDEYDREGVLAEDVASEALMELERLDKWLATIYGERRVIWGNKIEILDEEAEESRGARQTDQAFEGEAVEDLGGRRVEEWFYTEILGPVVEEMGGRKADILPQVEFASVIETDESEGEWAVVREKDGRVRFGRKKKDKRRMDFFLGNYRGKTKQEGRGMVIEVDDASHRGREDSDEARDRSVRANKMRVFRIFVEELRDAKRAKQKLKKALKGFYAKEDKTRETNKNGGFGRIIAGGEEILYQEVNFPGEILGWKGEEFLGREVGEEWRKWKIKDKPEVRQAVKEVFKYLFGFVSLREGQEEAIMRGLSGKDTVVLMPTGAGKSVIYQFLALILPGVGLIVEPLRALMEDQVENLRKRGISTVVNLSGEVNLREKQRLMGAVERGAFAMVYVTPERMQMLELRRSIVRAKRRGVMFTIVAMDEAHCVSEWGHDFRVAYLNLAETGRKMLEFKGRKPVVIGLTGTASENVLKDLTRDLGVGEEDIVRPESLDRPEIKFKIKAVKSREKFGELCRILEEERKMGSGIVFCVYKTEMSEFGVDAVYGKLSEKYPERKIVRYYGTEEKAEMRGNARAFREDEAEVMVATKAFGMGIDKGNIRFVVHFGIPNSIEAFYQEAGRAGRDGGEARAYVLVSDDFPKRNRELLTETTVQGIKEKLRYLSQSQRDDVSRLLFLHANDYNGRRVLKMTRRVLEEMGEISRERQTEKRIVAKDRGEFVEFQKVLFRLKMMGVVEDYMVSGYANNEFLLLTRTFSGEEVIKRYGEYVKRYQAGQEGFETERLRGRVRGWRTQGELILGVMEEMVRFVDGMFEKSRRRAILSMLELADETSKIKDEAEQDKEVRRRVLDYLGERHKGELGRILADETRIKEAKRVVFGVIKRGFLEGATREGILEARKMSAEGKRRLATYPEHPGLLLAVGAMELLDPETEVEQGVEEMLSAGESSEKYQIPLEEFLRTMRDIIRKICTVTEDKNRARRIRQRIGEGCLERGIEGVEEALAEGEEGDYFYRSQGAWERWGAERSWEKTEEEKRGSVEGGEVVEELRRMRERLDEIWQIVKDMIK